ncbi:Uracil phosphoribosyltransferase, partial [Bienertia sinuspersici]
YRRTLNSGAIVKGDVESGGKDFYETLEEQLTPSTKLTYREKRRLEQAELRLKYPNQKRRGPTRGKKYVSGIPILKKRSRLISWMSFDAWLAKMDKLAKQRLYDKIRLNYGCSLGKYDLPDKVGGADVIEALSFQCSMFRPNTINVDQWTWLVCEYWNDEKRKHISKINMENKLKQTESPTNGCKMNMPQTQPIEEHEESSNPLETQQDPLYITLFEKTKNCLILFGFSVLGIKKVDGRPNSQKDYEALKSFMKKKWRSMVKIHLV